MQPATQARQDRKRIPNVQYCSLAALGLALQSFDDCMGSLCGCLDELMVVLLFPFWSILVHLGPLGPSWLV